MIFEELISFQTFLGIIASIFMIYYLFLKKTAEKHENKDTVSSLNDDFYYYNGKIRRKSSVHEIDKMMHLHRSYVDVRRGIDVYSSLNNFSSKSYNKLPKEIIFLIDNVKVFGHFEESILLNLFPHMQTTSLLAGEHLYENCDPNNNIVVVQSGKMEVFVIIDDNHLHSIKVVEQVIMDTKIENIKPRII